MSAALLRERRRGWCGGAWGEGGTGGMAAHAPLPVNLERSRPPPPPHCSPASPSLAQAVHPAVAVRVARVASRPVGVGAKEAGGLKVAAAVAAGVGEGVRGRRGRLVRGRVESWGAARERRGRQTKHARQEPASGDLLIVKAEGASAVLLVHDDAAQIHLRAGEGTTIANARAHQQRASRARHRPAPANPLQHPPLPFPTSPHMHALTPEPNSH